jgi:hypothetical protein
MRAGNSIGQIRRVLFNPKDKARASSGEPAQAEKVQAGHIGDTALMNRSATFV